MYNVIDIESATPILDDNGNVRVFDTVQDAMLVVQGLFAITGKKYKPKQVIDSFWKDREANKFTNGEYKKPFWIDLFFYQTKIQDEQTNRDKLVWHYMWGEKDFSNCPNVMQSNVKLNINPEHFLHVSKLDSTKIAFTEDDSKGTNDRQTQMNVSRYLSQYCGIDNELAKYVNSLHEAEYKTYEVLFESKGTEIVKLYQKSPSSCMTKEACQYDSFCHPLLVYGESDISLAYMLNDDDRVKSRVLVWKEKKLYSRFYGDYETLKKSLNDMGYSSDDSFHGAKIKRIMDDSEDRLVLPYLDGCNTVSILDKNWLMIDEDGDILADTTNGLSRKKTIACCDSCGDDITDEDECNTVYLSRNNTRIYCGYCTREYTFTCNSSYDNIHNDECSIVDNESYASWLVEDEANYCEKTEEYTFDDIIEVNISEDETQFWRESLLDDKTFICRIDGKRYANKLKAEDSWNDEPRAIFNIPNDRPENCNDTILYHCHDSN